jgi:hypothetical protein
MENIYSKNVVNISCGHLFHTQCISSWKETSHSQTCPLCRTDYVTIDAQHLSNFNRNITTPPLLSTSIKSTMSTPSSTISYIDLTQ